jgi:hypothetical protein
MGRAILRLRISAGRVPLITQQRQAWAYTCACPDRHGHPQL